MPMIENGGISSIFIGGATYQVSADVTIKVGGIIRKVVTASDGVAGYTTEYSAPEIEFEALDGPAFSVTGLKGLVNTPFQVKMNNGKSYMLAGGTQIDDPSIKIKDGKVSGVKFTGTSCIEVGA